MGWGEKEEGHCVSLSHSLSSLSYSLIPRESVPVKKRHHVWQELQDVGALTRRWARPSWRAAVLHNKEENAAIPFVPQGFGLCTLQQTVALPACFLLLPTATPRAPPRAPLRSATAARVVLGGFSPVSFWRVLRGEFR